MVTWVKRHRKPCSHNWYWSRLLICRSFVRLVGSNPAHGVMNKINFNDIAPKDYSCHFYDCRYNAFGCCADEENREKCLEIVKLVLCMEENDD